MSRFFRSVVIAAVAGGTIAGAAAPAMAATGPTVTIAAKSQFKPVTGDVFVVFHESKYDKATISGAISGAASGDVATLFAQTFPYTAAATAAGSVTLAGATGSYSFSVAPALATRYYVEVLGGDPAATLATSATSTVYVSNLQVPAALSPCARPVCTERMRVQEWVPATALRDEIAKPWYFYLGLSLSSSGVPKAPAWLTLDTHAAISKSVKLGLVRFSRTITFSFRIGDDGYALRLNLCSKDTEAKDGLGLPGSHGCGQHRVLASKEYLG